MIDKNYLPPELAAAILEREAQICAAPLAEDIRELITLQAEECVEAAQRCTKILRFGLTENPWNGKHNRDTFESEMGDVVAIARILIALRVIDARRITDYADAKIEALRRPDGRLRVAKVPGKVASLVLGDVVREGGDSVFAAYLAKLAIDLAEHAGADPREVDALRRALGSM